MRPAPKHHDRGEQCGPVARGGVRSVTLLLVDLNLGEWLGLIAVVGAVIAIPSGILATRRFGNRRRQVWFVYDARPLIPNVATDPENLLKVTFQDVQVDVVVAGTPKPTLTSPLIDTDVLDDSADEPLRMRRQIENSGHQAMHDYFPRKS